MSEEHLLPWKWMDRGESDMNKIIEDFQRKYPTREEKENALKDMSDAQIDELIEAQPNIYGKIFYEKFRSKPYPHNAGKAMK